MNAPQNHFRRMLCLLLLATACFSISASAETNLLAETNSPAEKAPSQESTNASHALSEPQEPRDPQNAAAASIQQPVDLVSPLPNATASLVRVLGMLAVVLGLFLGGVWLFRNWQRLTIQRGNSPRLNVIETRSLGGRHAIFVVGYENERFLIASSPAGINMLTHLHAAEETATTAAQPVAAQPHFAATLAQMLRGK